MQVKVFLTQNTAHSPTHILLNVQNGKYQGLCLISRDHLHIVFDIGCWYFLLVSIKTKMVVCWKIQQLIEGRKLLYLSLFARTGLRPFIVHPSSAPLHEERVSRIAPIVAECTLATVHTAGRNTHPLPQPKDMNLDYQTSNERRREQRRNERYK